MKKPLLALCLLLGVWLSEQTSPLSSAESTATCADCKKCPKGSWASSYITVFGEAAPGCAKCPYGYSTVSDGQDSADACSVCAAGFGWDGEACYGCSIGFYAEDPTSDKKAACTACPAGTTARPLATSKSHCAAKSTATTRLVHLTFRLDGVALLPFNQPSQNTPLRPAPIGTFTAVFKATAQPVQEVNTTMLAATRKGACPSCSPRDLVDLHVAVTPVAKDASGSELASRLVANQQAFQAELAKALSDGKLLESSGSSPQGWGDGSICIINPDATPKACIYPASKIQAAISP